MKKFCFLMVLSFVCMTNLNAQGKIAIKTNLLYGIGTLTPNLGAEVGLGDKSTLDLWGSYNPWKLNGSENDNKKLAHWIIQPEYRYWFCERFNGHFIGVHAFYGDYNISQHNIPLLLESGAKDYRYKGDIYGAGVSYGYHLMLSKHFNIQFNAGFGYGRMKYDKYECPRCGDKIETDKKRNYFGPTKLGITLVYLIK